MRTYTREELLALTPQIYLSEGYLDRMGRPHPELAADFATAAACQSHEDGWSTSLDKLTAYFGKGKP